MNKNKKFEENIVYRILRNEKYTGKYKHKDEIIENMYPPIISRDLFEKALSITRKTKNSRDSVKCNYLLKGKLFCAYCGMRMSAECSTSHSGKLFHYYKCRGIKRYRSDCISKSVSKDYLEQCVVNTIVSELIKTTNMETIINGLLKTQEDNNESNSVLKNLEKDKKQTQNSLDNILKAIENGIINKTTNNRMMELEKHLEEVESKILIESNKRVIKISREEIKEYYELALKKSPELLIAYLVDNIKVYNDKIEITLNNPIKKSPNNSDSSFLFVSKIKYNNLDILINI